MADLRSVTDRIAVIGAGYVGLTVAACLAHLGHHVLGTDILESRVAGLNDGQVPLTELGLTELVREGIEARRLRFGTDNLAAVGEACVVFLCVPTPQGDDGSADLSHVRSVAREIGPHLLPGAIVINKSTVPVGSAQVVADIIGRPDVHVISNPEFLREGSAVGDFLRPERVIIGSHSQEAATRVADLYRTLDSPILFMDPESAELVKYASNSFLATKLSFVNSVAVLCDSLGADVRHVTAGMGLDSRIGPRFLEPGPGWGGSCFPKDSQALLRTSAEVGFDFAVLGAAVKANDHHQELLVDQIEALAGGTLDGRTVALWGLTFKAGTDDLRQSPALQIAEALRQRGAAVRAYDPVISHPVDGIEVAATAEAAADGASVLVVATEWDEFRTVELNGVATRMDTPAILDARNLLDEATAVDAGFRYQGVGTTHRPRATKNLANV